MHRDNITQWNHNAQKLALKNILSLLIKHYPKTILQIMIPKRLRAKRGEEFLSCSILESLEIGSLAIPWVHKSLFARVVKWESSKRALITRPAAASEAVEEAVSIFLVGEFVSLYVRKICILLRPYEIFGWLLPACLPVCPPALLPKQAIQADFFGGIRPHTRNLR